MKIILLQDVRGVGRKNDIKEVADGYGRNFLIARGLAKIATLSEIQALVTTKKDREIHGQKVKERLEEFAKKISDEVLEIHAPAGAKGELFKAVTAEVIAGEIRKKYPDEPLEKLSISLEKPIKAVGEYQAKVGSGKDFHVSINARVLPQKPLD